MALIKSNTNISQSNPIYPNHSHPKSSQANTNHYNIIYLIQVKQYLMNLVIQLFIFYLVDFNNWIKFLLFLGYLYKVMMFARVRLLFFGYLLPYRLHRWIILSVIWRLWGLRLGVVLRCRVDLAILQLLRFYMVWDIIFLVML